MKRPFRSAMLANSLLALLLLSATPTSANCVNPAGSGGCFSSIQDAVTAAAVGETVSIAAGTYFENVTVATDGLVLLGVGPNTILDPDTPNSGDGIEVAANDVTIKSLLIRNGDDDGIFVDAGATGTRITNVGIRGPNEDCIDIRGDDTLVERSTLRGCGNEAIRVEASDVRILRNTLTECDDECIEAQGSNLEIVSNKFSPCGGECIRASGVNIKIERNQIAAADAEGIEVSGENLSVQRNSVKATDGAGILVSCGSCTADPTRTIFAGGPNTAACRQFDGDQASCEAAWHFGGAGAASCFYDSGSCLGCGPNNSGSCTNTCAGSPCTGIVAGNSVADIDHECFDLDSSGPGLVVERNTASRCTEEGYEISGTGMVLRGNRALDSGTEDGDAGFDIVGNDHVLKRNIARRNRDDGFGITGTGHTLTENGAYENGEDGFDVGGDGDGATDVTLTGNLAEDNNAVGIEVDSSATGTIVNDNTASGNHTDFCDEGTGTTTAGNTFGTTGPCVID